MPVKDKLISNTIFLFLDWFALTIIGFLFWFVAGKTLLKAELGIVSTSINFALILGGLSLLGLQAAVWKLTPEYLAKRQNNKIISLIRFSLKVMLLSNLIILLILFSLSSYISHILKIPLNVLFITGAILFFISVSNQFYAVIYGFQDMKKVFSTDLFGQLLKLVVSAVLIFLGFKYYGPLIGVLVGFILIALLRMKYILLKIKSIPLIDKAVKIDKKSIMFNYALPAFITSTLWLVFTSGQYVLLTALKSPDVTGIYTIAMVLTSMLAIVPTTLNSGLLPITSQLSAEKNAKNKQSYLIGLIFRYGLFITLPIAVLLGLFSKTIILLFSTAEFLSASQFFPLLILASLVYGFGNIFNMNLYAIGKTKVNRNIVIAVTIIFILLAFPFIRLFSALGLALAYFISTLFLALLSFFYLRKFLKLKLPWGNIGRLMISGLISFGLLYAVMSIFHGILIGIIFGCIALLLYLIILLPLKFFTKEDIKILDFIIERSPILNKQIIKLRDLLLKFVAK